MITRIHNIVCVTCCTYTYFLPKQTALLLYLIIQKLLALALTCNNVKLFFKAACIPPRT